MISIRDKCSYSDCISLIIITIIITVIILIILNYMIYLLLLNYHTSDGVNINKKKLPELNYILQIFR